MSNDKAPKRDRPYEIRERLALFAEEVVKAAQNAQARKAIAAALSPNLVRAAVSAAAKQAGEGQSTLVRHVASVAIATWDLRL